MEIPLAHLHREIFGNISTAEQVVFYLLATVAGIIVIVGSRRRSQRWRMGKAVTEGFSWSTLRDRVREIVWQPRIAGRGIASAAHRLLATSFAVLFVGTCLVALEHVLAMLWGRNADNPVIHRGIYFALFEVTLDVFGAAMLIGAGLFVWRRWRLPASVDHQPSDWLVLGLLIAIGLTGFLVEGLRILREQTPYPWISFMGMGTARLWEYAMGREPATVAWTHTIAWWAHAVMALSWLAMVPYTRLWHFVAGALHIAHNEETLGAMREISLDEFTETGRMGVEHLRDLRQDQLRSIDACVACGRCEEACPAFEAGKPLSPKRLVQDLAQAMTQTGASAECSILTGKRIGLETLWSCTTCGACATACPLHVAPIEMITDMRRFAVTEGRLSGPPATALQKSLRSGNPWGLPAQDRLKWAQGLDVPTAQDNPEFQVLYWVGCAAAYDPRAQKIARAVVRLLQHASVNFAVLGSQERCVGECQRRMGDEFLFRELAEQNLRNLDACGARTIMTHCPHCLNSLRQDYRPLGGHFEVVHHSEFLQGLLHSGQLAVASCSDSFGQLTYHDPCYLARIQGEEEAPRHILHQIAPQGSLSELQRQRSGTACCGGGGGRMWFDDSADQRVGSSRAREIAAHRAQTVATACPFCLTMVSDNLSRLESDQRVADVAELLWEAVSSERESPLTSDAS